MFRAYLNFCYLWRYSIDHLVDDGGQNLIKNIFPMIIEFYFMYFIFHNFRHDLLLHHSPFVLTSIPSTPTKIPYQSQPLTLFNFAI